MPSDVRAKTRIMLLARVFPPRIGGIENYIYNIYSRLASRYDITVVAPNWPESQSFDAGHAFVVARSPQVPKLNERYGTPLIGMLMVGIGQLLLKRPEQIHCDQVETAIVGRILATMGRVPLVVYGYAMELTDNTRIRSKRWAVQKAAATIAISRYTSTQLTDRLGVPPATIHIVSPGVDVGRFHPKVDGSGVKTRYGLDGKKVILTVGRLASGERYKGHDSVIQSMPSILRDVPEAAYLIVGDGPDRERLETLSRQLKLDTRVIFAGAVPDHELPQYYAACDVFVMASREGRCKRGGVMTEGFGIVFLEAGACGRPTVGTRTGGIPDAIVDGVTGLLVAPEAPDNLPGAIVSVLADQALADRLGVAGRRRAEREFHWDVSATKVSCIVDSLRGDERR